MAVAAPTIVKNYWYYSNGFYELESLRKDGWDVEHLQRSLLGPIPFEDLCLIGRGVAPIDPNTPNWQALLIGRLGAQFFHTQNIRTHVPREIGKTVSSYIQSFVNLESTTKAGVVGGGIISVGLVAKHAPGLTSTLGGMAKNSTYGLLGAACLGWGGHALYESFKTWQVAEFEKFSEDRSSVVPEAFRNDPVLTENICAITTLPIRVPFRSIHGHVYEEAAIKAYIRQQIANGINPPLRPGGVEPLTLDDIHPDNHLSDRIELRIVLLGSQIIRH